VGLHLFFPSGHTTSYDWALPFLIFCFHATFFFSCFPLFQYPRGFSSAFLLFPIFGIGCGGSLVSSNFPFCVYPPFSEGFPSSVSFCFSKNYIGPFYYGGTPIFLFARCRPPMSFLLGANPLPQTVGADTIISRREAALPSHFFFLFTKYSMAFGRRSRVPPSLNTTKRGRDPLIFP